MHTRRVKERLELSREEDIARDRTRVKEMYKNRRLRDKPDKNNNNNDHGYAVLGSNNNDDNKFNN